MVSNCFIVGVFLDTNVIQCFFLFHVLIRCSSQYTSVTMTSILLRCPLPLRHCAGMWWSCARNLGRWTATCLRCGGDQVTYSLSWLILHNGMYANFSYLLFWLWNITPSPWTFIYFNAKKTGFLFFLRKLCMFAVWSASFLKKLISFGLQHKCRKAHNLCNKHGLQAISHISQVEICVEIFLPFPIFFLPSSRAMRYSKPKPGFIVVSMVMLL